MKTKIMKRENSIVRIFKAGAVSFIVTIILIAVLSGIIYFTDVSDRFISNSALALKYISALFAGFLCGKGAQGKGFLCGAAASAVYMVVLCLAGIMISGGAVDESCLRYVLTGALAGAIGGVIGINCR